MTLLKVLVATLVCSVSFVGSSSARSGSIILPISSVTPGATNPAVTQANIHSTICMRGYTKTIRPPSSYTTQLKRQQLAGAYSFYHDNVTGHFEEDHLISLELGGSPSDPRNLWPEPYSGSTGARIKDKIENKLHALVCSGQVTLRVAQNAIASNWYTAYQRYMSVRTKGATSSGTYTGGTSSNGGGTQSNGGNGHWPAGATGLCRDGTYSHSQTHRGMCSRHGGVAVFGS